MIPFRRRPEVPVVKLDPCRHDRLISDLRTVEDLVVLESVMCPRCGREWRTAQCSSGFEADYAEAARAMSAGVGG